MNILDPFYLVKIYYLSEPSSVYKYPLSVIYKSQTIFNLTISYTHRINLQLTHLKFVTYIKSLHIHD